MRRLGQWKGQPVASGKGSLEDLDKHYKSERVMLKGLSSKSIKDCCWDC